MTANNPTTTILEAFVSLSEVLSNPSPLLSSVQDLHALVNRLEHLLRQLEEHAEILDTARKTILQFLTRTMMEYGTLRSAIILWNELLRLDACLVPSCIEFLNSPGPAEHISTAERTIVFHPHRMPTLQPLERLASEGEVEVLSHVRQVIKHLCSSGLAEGHVLCGIGHFGWRTLRVMTIFVLGIHPQHVRRDLNVDIPIISLTGRLTVASSSFSQPPPPHPLPHPGNVQPTSSSHNPPLADDATSGKARATRLIFDGAYTPFDRKERQKLLASITGVRGAFMEPPLLLGQSISGRAMNGTLGSFCCHLTHENSGPDKYYGLTACHVVIPTSLHQLEQLPEVVYPAFLDRLAALSRELPLLRGRNSSTTLEEILAWDRVAGRVVDYELGVDGAGWRADWALLELDAEKQAKNDFYALDEVREIVMQPLQEDLEVLVSRDPRFGEVVLKDGARTGATTGIVQGEDVYAFFIGTIAPAPMIADAQLEDKANIEECRLRLIWPTPGEMGAADSGDSGCPVFGMEEAGGLAFLGMTVALVYDETGARKYALFVPQSVLFNQLKEKTGVQWAVANSG
ncbi:hypothetical protein BDD12DRAFT_806534 [Trichophaea hybrida]|nr:hypothetical protein BDD12DRAFT_806534 [Trichophaea hybrida]